MGINQQFCTFHLGELFLGIEVGRVQEVIKFQEMTQVPLAPSTVRGLINLRGQIVTAIDLRQRFGISQRDDSVLPMNVVIRDEDGAVSLLVDEIGDVIQVSEEDYENTPENLEGVAKELILGVYKLADKLMLILDTDKAIYSGAN